MGIVNNLNYTSLTIGIEAIHNKTLAPSILKVSI